MTNSGEAGKGADTIESVETGKKTDLISAIQPLPMHFRPGWVFVLASTVVVTAVVIAAIIILRKGDLTSPQFRMGVTFLTFALSVVSGVIFAPHAHLKGTIGLLGVYVAGPAALWLVSLVAFRYLFPEDPGPAFPNQVSDLTLIVKDVQRREGWITLEEWKAFLGPLHVLFEGKDEESNMRQLLSGAYITGSPRLRPSRPKVQTLFFYPPTSDETKNCEKQAVKLQRISSDDSPSGSLVFATATNTLANGTSNFAVITKEDDRITGIFSDTSPWIPIAARTVDALIIARYCNGQLPTGDWLQIHVPKYLGSGKATVDFGLASLRPIIKQQAWEMRASSFSSPDAPVVFRSLSQEPASNVTHLRAELEPWLRILKTAALHEGGVWEKFPNAGENARRLVKTVLSQIDGWPGRVPFFDDPSLSAISYHIDGLENAAIVSFEWGDEPSLSARGGP